MQAGERTLRRTTHIFIYQHIPFDENALHRGDGGGISSGNSTSIGIEMCENSDMNYAQGEGNAIVLSVLLMREFNLIPGDAVSH